MASWFDAIKRQYIDEFSGAAARREGANNAAGYLKNPVVQGSVDFANQLVAKANDPTPIFKYSSYSGSGDSAPIDYKFADLAQHYGMDASTAYQEALSNTSYQRMVSDLQAAGLNPVMATGRTGANSNIYGSLAGSPISGSRFSASSAKSMQTGLSALGAIVDLVIPYKVLQQLQIPMRKAVCLHPKILYLFLNLY